MIEYDWGVEIPVFKSRPQRPSNPMITQSFDNDLVNGDLSKTKSSTLSFLFGRSSSNASSISMRMSRVNLGEISWYWGALDRNETMLVLKNCPDGSFLVRDSSLSLVDNTNKINSSINSPYTLCVTKGGLIKSIRIFKQESAVIPNKFYDIEKPCRFESVQALVSYYSRVSLKEYNRNLDLVLTYGVSKFKFGKTTDWTIDKLYSSYRGAIDEYDKLQKKCEGLESDINLIREDLSQKKQGNEALDKIIQMYEAQIAKLDEVLNENLFKKTLAISTTRLLASQLLPVNRSNNDSNEIQDDETRQINQIMNQNKSKVKSRIDELLKRKEVLANDIDYLNTIIHQLQGDLDLIRFDLVELNKKRENYHMWLVKRGEDDEKIESSLTESEQNERENKNNLSFDNFSYIKDGENVHSNSLNWFKADLNRDEASDLLKLRENGTYLVRSNLKSNSKYILSVVCKQEIKHILIDEDNEGCFIKSSKPNNLDSASLSSSRSSLNSVISSSSSNITKLTDIDISVNNISPKFKNLTELICYYSGNKLVDNNVNLDLILANPVFL
jgi:hypothetical protein